MFTADSLEATTDFTSLTFQMLSLTPNSADFTSETGVTITSLSNESINEASGSVMPTANSWISTPSNIYFQTDDQSYTIISGSTQIFNPDLPCYSQSSAIIDYSTSDYAGFIGVSSWATIDSSSGILTVKAPSVSSDTPYKVYIDSSISGYSSPIKKIIVLNIKACSDQNCKNCSNSDITICTVCNSSFILSSGLCIASSSSQSSNSNTTNSSRIFESAKATSITTQSIIGLILF